MVMRKILHKYYIKFLFNFSKGTGAVFAFLEFEEERDAEVWIYFSKKQNNLKRSKNRIKKNKVTNPI